MGSLERQIENKLFEIGVDRLASKKIILFGAGGYSRRLYKILRKKGYSVSAVIDNNKALEGHLLLDMVVQDAEGFLKEFDDERIFPVLSRFYREIKRQLEKHGYVENVHFFKMADIDEVDEWHIVDEERMDQCVFHIRRGKKLHEELVKRYGSEAVLLVNPAASIGDVYLMSFYVKAYLKDHVNRIFIFGSHTLVRLAGLLDFGTVLYVESDQIQALIDYAGVFGFEKVRIKLLHTGYIHFRIWSRMLTYVGITWMEHYKELFELPDAEEICVKRLTPETEASEYFAEYGFIPGRTVILSPYANTIRQLPDEFWRLLAKRLSGLGYCVCTNLGSPREKEVLGTVPVHIEISSIQAFAEYAGCFIGIRSGLCDLLCTCRCFKIILYSDEIFDLISVYDFYSLQKMGFGENVLEIVIENRDSGKALDDIVSKFKNRRRGEKTEK